MRGGRRARKSALRVKLHADLNRWFEGPQLVYGSGLAPVPQLEEGKLTMSDRLKGARVLVIGGSSGIGLATAAAAAEDGGSVTIASRSKAKLDEALARIG